MTAWVQMTTAAGYGWSVEPNSDRAIAQAAAARPAGVIWAVALVALAVALAAVTGCRWLALLGLPGVVVALFLLFAPGPNGGAFFYGLLASVLAVAASVHVEVRQRLRLRKRAAARPDPH